LALEALTVSNEALANFFVVERERAVDFFRPDSRAAVAREEPLAAFLFVGLEPDASDFDFALLLTVLTYNSLVRVVAALPPHAL
jgi:hypothetical protein